MEKKFQIQISENSFEFLFVIPSPGTNELAGIDNLENYIICEKKETNISWRSIDEAVESVYDSFYEALTEGKDVTLFQTDFCKTYDYMNHDALLHILKGLNTPPQVIYIVEKVL